VVQADDWRHPRTEVIVESRRPPLHPAEMLGAVAARLRLDQEDAASASDYVIEVSVAVALDVVQHRPSLSLKRVERFTNEPFCSGSTVPADLHIEAPLRVGAHSEDEQEEDERRRDAESLPECEYEHESANHCEARKADPDEALTARSLRRYPLPRSRGGTRRHLVLIGPLDEVPDRNSRSQQSGGQKSVCLGSTVNGGRPIHASRRPGGSTSRAGPTHHTPGTWRNAAFRKAA
jgi:hypothetical protein